MRVTKLQTNFSTGALDPLMRARTDLQQYQNALEEATNVIIQPQGGAKRRDGTKYIAALTETSFKLIPFEFSVDDKYLLIVVPGKIYAYKDDVAVANITATALTADIVSELNYTQAVDTLILCHPDLQTKRLVRNSDSNWTFENLPLKNIPKYAYTLDTHEPTYSIAPSATTGNITITASSVTTDNGTAQAGTTSTITLKAATSFTSDDQPNGMFIEITSGTGSGQTRHVEDYVASTKVLTVYPDWTTAPDNTSAYEIKAFKPAAVGEYAQVKSTFGRARYVEYVSDTQMKAVVEVPFFDTSTIVSGDWESEHGYEDVWSSTKGWPASAAFHEGRLYFGGSKSRPNTIWGSRVIDYFNFDIGTGLDDESVEATINTTQLNKINHVVSGNDFRIFTTGGEFIVIQGQNDPITPSNFLIRPQTRLGSKPGVPIDDLNGASLFVQRQGKSINAFQYGDSVNSYQIQPISIFSSHLLSDPVDLTVRRSASTDESDRAFIVNDDGTIVCYSIFLGQNVIAPSKFTTDGEFLAITALLDEVYVVVKRTIQSVAKYMVEKFDPDVHVDSAVTGTAASASSSLVHIAGKSVKIIRDGIVEADQSAPISSPYTVTFDQAATESYEVGLNFDVTVKTMPAEPMLSSGSVVGVKKRIVQVDTILNDTQDLVVNSKQVSFRSLGEDVLDTAITKYTGIKTVHGLLGYSDTGQITITQNVPLDMNVLGIEYKLSVGD